MQWADKATKTTIKINDNCLIKGIPPQAHEYKISGRSPLEWAVHYLKKKETKLDDPALRVDDPNKWYAWADDPQKLVRHLKRLCFLSVRSAEIISSLPPSLEADSNG